MSGCSYVEISPLSYNQKAVVCGTTVVLFCFEKEHYYKMDTTVDNLLYSIVCFLCSHEGPCYTRNRRHPEHHGHCTMCWHHRTDTHSLQQDIQTQYHGNYKLVLLYHSTTETAALHPQPNTDEQLPMYPSYCTTRHTATPVPSDRHCQILLLSPFISPVITPEQTNSCWCLYLKRMHREKSSWGLHHCPPTVPAPFPSLRGLTAF